MGVKGAGGYFHDLSIVLSSPSASNRKHHAWDDVFRSDHLLLDLNCILHGAFRKESERLSDFLPLVKQKLKALLKLFSPHRSITLLLDGVAPLSKLEQQRRRREKLPEPKCPLTPDFLSSRISFFHEEISAGSPFVWACEKELQAAVPSIIKELYINHEELKIYFSGSREPGEGEVKIASFLNRFVQEEVAMETDAISIVGNDSDLVFVGLLATSFEKVFVVNPDSLEVTSIPLLLNRWRTAVPNPPLHASLLRTYRVDFTFIMFLAGTDYYAGIGMGDAKAVWSAYRHLRANGGYYQQALIDAEKHWEIDVGFLRVLLSTAVKRYTTGNRGKRTNVVCDSASGKEVLAGSMWGLQTFASGKCVNMNFLPLGGQLRFPSLKSLEQAAKQKNIASDMKNMERTPEWVTNLLPSSPSTEDIQKTSPLLTPFEQYISVLGRRGRYSPAVFSAFEDCIAQGDLITYSSSTSKIVEAVKRITSAAKFNALYEHEQEMMTFLSIAEKPISISSLES